jgi:hypothetical protein
MIAESLYSQCDPDGHEYILLDEIVDHRCTDRAIKLADQKAMRANGKTYLRRLTFGWQLCCQWKDGSSSWVNLADLKDSHPIEVAKYAKILGIDHEPAFNWWVPHILKNRDRIISLMKKRSPQFLKRTQKLGIEVPKTVKEALELDKKNGNTIWADAIAKEMKDVCVAFKILPDGLSAPLGYQKIPCPRLPPQGATGRQGTQDRSPVTLTYASVVSRETVRIALLMAALNNLEVKVGDVLNAYITDPITIKVWTAWSQIWL